MKIVLDTNVLVSGILSPQGTPATVLRAIASGSAAICFDERILSEYRRVLARRKFSFDPQEVATLLELLETTGQRVLAPPLDLSLPDPSDEPFVEVAIAAAADFLVTGNMKHFPAASLRGMRAITPRAFCDVVAR